MQPIKIFSIKRAVSKIKHISDKIVVVDESNTVRIFDLNELKLSGGFKINLPPNRVLGNSVDISKDGKFLGLTIPKKNKAVLWNLETKKLANTIGWHKGEVETIAFDYKNRYVATGGIDGRTNLWSIETGKMVANLAPHSDYVTAIGFSYNGMWCATGSYDKSISITNISSMQFAYKMRIHSGMVTKIHFLRNFFMISGDKNGELVISNYAKGKVVKRLPKLPDIVVDFVVDGNEKFIFATTKNRNIYLYDLEKYELLSDNYIKTTSTITCLEFIPDLMYLIVGTNEGILYIYDILSDEKELELFIENKEYSKAYEIIAQNPLLKNSLSYNYLEKIWENRVHKAQILLEKSEKEKAEEILRPFMSVAGKRMFIQALFKDFVEFDKFKKLVVNKKYPLAYSLANKYPTFKETTYYKFMEKEFKKAFAVARQLMFDRTKEDYVKKLLMPFRGVPEKTALIQSLVTEKEIFKLLKQKLSIKDFKGFFDLISRYPFLASLDEYDKAVEFGKRLLEAGESALKNGNYSNVLKYVKILLDFPMFEEEAKNLEYKAVILADFIKFSANKEYDKVYEYVKKEPFLEGVDDFINIEKSWENRVKEAEKYSAKGDVIHIVNSLKHYMKIKEKLPKIGELVKNAYLYQILEKLKTEVSDEVIEKGFKNYIKIFGLDLEISDLITLGKKSGRKFDFTHIEEGNKNSWHKHKLPPSIFES